MLSLARCSKVFGNSNFVKAEPDLRTHCAVLVPGYWGLFDHGRRLITSSGYFRGPGPELYNGAYALGAAWPSEIEQAEDDNYFYLGPIHQHYGHFLLSTLSRLWPLSKKNSGGIKLVTSTRIDVEAYPFMAKCLATIGLSQHNICVVDRPTCFARIVVAAPSFEEQNYVHQAYARLCDEVARGLLIGFPAFTRSTPCYLAKFAMQSGVGKIENEEVVAERLSTRGVEVVFPEQIALAEQIMLFRDRDAIAGIVGSAFHTASFTRKARMLMIAYGSAILSNQLLVDRAGDHDSHYVHAREGLSLVQQSGFNSVHRFKNPEAVADDFMRVFDAFAGRQGDDEESRSQSVAPVSGALKNLAIGRPTRQSSVSEFSFPPSLSGGSRGGVSGFCTGGFQFHTALEAEPWWDVDLGDLTQIHEIRLYNRLDGCMHRAAKFAIKLSLDGENWTEVFNKTSEESFGGLNSVPFSWVPPKPVHSRFVRIALLQKTYFHLDQVAVFGPAI